MGVKNNTEFDVKWLRQKGFVGNTDGSDSVIPLESNVFGYSERMRYEGHMEIKVLITIDLVIPASSRIFYQYHNSHGKLQKCEYNGEIMSKGKLILLLEAIYPELAKKFAE